MLEIRSKSNKNQIKVGIKGDASVQNAGKICEKLKSLLAEKKSMEINTAEVKIADLSFLQILGAAYKSLHSLGLKLSFTDNSISEPIQSAIRKTGFFHSKMCSIVPGEPSPFYSLTANKEAE